MSQPDDSRLATELELLEAMYPEQMDYDVRSRDLKYSQQSALLHLRLPEFYPNKGLPDIISAHDESKNDIRDGAKTAVEALGLTDGEEALDAVIASFQGLVDGDSDSDSDSDSNLGAGTDICSDRDGVTVSQSGGEEPSKTVIIWLHHLLALGKRKLALAPSPSVSGITKPGYPGIMVFSGPASAVLEHVNTLKAENWQAFQIRFEGDECWEFAHGVMVTEVETMSEVVTTIDFGTYGARRKMEFLQAIGIK